MDLLDFEFSTSTIIAGLFFGVIGFYLMKEGRKRVNYAWAFIGLALMIYPMFVSKPFLCWLIGVGLCGVAYHYR